MRTRSDSSRPWSPEEIELGMADVSEKIEDGVAAFKSLGEEAATKKRDYEMEHSKLLLLAATMPELKSAELREAWVYTQVADLKLAADIADHLVRSQAKTLDGLEHQKDLLRSAGKSHRDMSEGGGWGENDMDSARRRRASGGYG